MKKVLPFAIAALMIPGVALAKGPNPGTHTNHGKAKVMYVLRGMIYGYTAYDSTTSTPGSITIDVSRSNRHGKLLVGQTPLTVTIGPNTKVLLTNGVASIPPPHPATTAWSRSGPRGWLSRASTVPDVQNALMNQPAHQVIDRGPAS